MSRGRREETSMRHKNHVGGLLLVAGCLALAGCGYPRRSLLRDDIRTVYVPVFANHTWHRGLEVELTRAVAEEVKLHTYLRFAPRQQADSTLEGELLAFEESGATKTEDDEILLTTVTATVRFRWTDNLTGSEIVPNQTIRERLRYPVAVGEPLEREVFRGVAQRIVEKMEKAW